jgi:pantoate--beta-alanine ligase
MIIIPEVARVRDTVQHYKRANQRIAFVPTMGNLHAGHLSLVAAAKARADKVVVSIFVNPAQFGPNEDYATYPRTLEEDCQALSAAGVDLVFTPSAESLYPKGIAAHTLVRVPVISEGLCSRTRPQFLQGVTTIVNILFNIIQPDIAIFGEKDYQQLRCIQTMVKDLHMPIDVIGMPTQREKNGLAMSSRNRYLTPEQREQAAGLYHTLQTLVHELKSAPSRYLELEQAAHQALDAQGFKTDYVSVRSQIDLSLPDDTATAWVVLAAAYLGHTRLIDNIPFVL